MERRKSLHQMGSVLLMITVVGSSAVRAPAGRASSAACHAAVSMGRAERTRPTNKILMLSALHGLGARISRGAFIRTAAAAVPIGRSRGAGAADLQAKEPGDFFATAYDAVGRWLTDHPAPLWLVNNPVKRWVTTKSAGEYDRATTRETLTRLIAQDEVVVFSATYCPFSLAAKRTLDDQGVEFRTVEWNTREDGACRAAHALPLTPLTLTRLPRTPLPFT